jgi:hypothetical protein
LNETVFFNGKFEGGEASEWIKSVISTSIQLISNPGSFWNLDLSSTDQTPFLISYQDQKHENFGLARAVARKYRSLSLKFYGIKNSRWKLEARRSSDFSTTFSGLWTPQDLGRFVRQNAFPLVSPFSGSFITKLKKFGMMSLVAFIDPNIYLSDIKHIAQELVSDFPFSYVDATKDSERVKSYGLKPNSPQIILLNPSTGQWVLYHGEMTDAALGKWINGLVLSDLDWRTKGGHESSHDGSDGLVYLMYFFLVVALVIGIRYIVVIVIKKRPHHRKSMGFEVL